MGYLYLLEVKKKMNKYFKNIDIFLFGTLKFGLYTTLKLFISKFIFNKNAFRLDLSRYFPKCVFNIRNQEDSSVFIEHLLTDYYCLEIESRVNNFVLVDCGAFNGIEGLRLYGNLKNKINKFTYIGIEPNTYNFSILKKNLRSFKDFVLYNKAIHAEDNLQLIEKKKSSLGQSFYYIEENKSNIQNTQSISINQIMKENNLSHIDILKIDIEGSEEILFSKNTSWTQKVDCIIFEIYHVSDVKLLAKILNTISHLNDFDIYNHKENLVLLKRETKLSFKTSRGIVS